MSFRLSIRTKLALAFLALTVLTVGVSVALSMHRLTLYINEQAVDELRDERRTAQLSLRLEQTEARTASAALASRTDLQDAVSDQDRNALQSIAAQSLREQGADAIVITDHRGTVLADARDPAHPEGAVTGPDVLTSMLEGVSVATITRPEGTQIYAIGGVPVFNFGSPQRIIGTIVVGHALDQQFVETLNRTVGEELSLIIDGRRQYTTFAKEDRLEIVTPANPDSRAVIKSEGQSYYAVYGPLQGQDGAEPIGFIEIAKSNTSIQNTTRDIVGGVIALMSAIGLAALGVAYWLSSRMTRPLARLTDAAKALGRGDFSQRVTVESGDELEILADTFNTMSDDIQRTQAERELQAEQQAALAELGQRALVRTDLHTLMQRAADMVAHYLNVEYSKVLELYPGQQALRLVAGVGWQPGYLGHATIDVSEGSQVGETLMSVEPIIIEDAATETRFTLPRLLTEHDVTSGLSVAINSGQRVYGILGAHTKRRRTFTDDEALFLRTVSNVLAAAIERDRAETALKESETRYRQLIELFPEMIVVFDDEKVLYLNQAGAELARDSQIAEIVGNPNLDISSAIRATQERPPLEVRRDGKRILQRQLAGPDGATLYFEVTSAPMTYLGKPARQAIVRDVTERRRAEEQLQHYTARLEALHEIDSAMLAMRSPRDVASAALTQLRGLVPSTGAEVTLFDFESGIAQILASDADDSDALAAGTQFPLDTLPDIEKLRQGEPVLVTAEAAPDGPDGNSAPAPSRSRIIMPLIVQDTLTGVLNLVMDGSASIGQQHQEIVQEVANQLAVAIQQARLDEQIQNYNVQLERRVNERTAELVVANKLLKREIREHRRTEEAEREQRTLAEALRDTSAALNRTLDLDEVIERILTQLGRVVPHDVANIMLVEGSSARIAGSRGYTQHKIAPEAIVYQYMISEHPTLRRMAVTRQPLAISDTRTAGESEWAAIPERDWLRSYAGAPIHWNEEIIGFINVESATPGYFTPAHAERLGAFADQASIAIRNAQLFRQAQELATLQERQRLAHELHDAVSQTLWSASLIADVLPTMWEANPEKGKDKLARLKQLTRGALAEMRTLLLELRPTALVESSINDLLRQLAEAIASRTRAEIDLDLPEQCLLPDELQMMFYRIAQESLSNIARHAMATHIKICLSCGDDYVKLDVTDNGQGFDPAQIPAGHFGVGIMKERAAAVGAVCTVTSAIGQGTQVSVTWVRQKLAT